MTTGKMTILPKGDTSYDGDDTIEMYTNRKGVYTPARIEESTYKKMDQERNAHENAMGRKCGSAVAWPIAKSAAKTSAVFSGIVDMIYHVNREPFFEAVKDSVIDSAIIGAIVGTVAYATTYAVGFKAGKKNAQALEHEAVMEYAANTMMGKSTGVPVFQSLVKKAMKFGMAAAFVTHIASNVTHHDWSSKPEPKKEEKKQVEPMAAHTARSAAYVIR